MINELERKRLYSEAFSILEKANAMLIAAGLKHEKSVAEASKKAA